MDSELLLKFIGYFLDYLSTLSRTLLRFLWTTFVETARPQIDLYSLSKNDSCMIQLSFRVPKGFRAPGLRP